MKISAGNQFQHSRGRYNGALPRYAALILFLSLQASADEVSLTATNPSVLPGETVFLQLEGDFLDEGTLGGGMDITFDPAVFSFGNYMPEPTGDPAYRRNPDVFPGLLSGAAFGEFTGIHIPVLIASIQFTVDSNAPTGTFEIGVAASSGIAGPFASLGDFEEQTINFSPAQITILGLCNYTVTMPTSGLDWRLGSIQPIRWNSSGNDCGANVSLELLDNDSPIATLAASTQNDGAFSWFVDATPTGMNYSIRVIDLDNFDYTADSAEFSIVNEAGFIFSTGYE